MPKPEMEYGEALIEVMYGGICGSDAHVYHGLHPTATFPVVPGHEFVGKLVGANGPIKAGLTIGDIVVAQPYTTCGDCEPCITGNDNVCTHLKLLGAHRDGCFAEYVTVSASKVYKVPDGVDPKLAALAEPLAVAIHDVRMSELRVGDNVMIIGGGVIGVFIAIVAAQAGANVTISEISEYRQNFIKDLGFRVFNPLDKDYNDNIKNIVGEDGFDVVFEVSGSKAGVQSSVGLTKVSGTIVIVGMCKEPYPVDTTQIFLKQIEMKGVRIHSQEAFKAAVNLLGSGALNDKLYKLISKQYKLSEINQAYDYMCNNTDFFKLLVNVGEENR
jgi:2-desacetyl-2-hydroxyethyl bacteriochlorophyllide A dehydrogenase